MDKDILDDLDFVEEDLLTEEEYIQMVKDHRKKDGYKVTFTFDENGKSLEKIMSNIIRSHM